MKTLLLVLSSFTVLFASNPQEREAKLHSVVDIEIKHTDKIEKRISKIHAELEKKAALRLEKDKLREAKLQKLDKELQLKADARQKASK